jgi:serine/threonine-protein kinase
MVGQTISHYRVLEKLGEGGMGIVYKAQDLKLDRFVALKFLPQNITPTEAEKTRFIHEAKAASALDHPNICTVYEIDETPDGQLFIVMALYEGIPLNKKIEQGPLKIDEAIETAIQAAEGLRAAHEKGIIHRDIKSGNLILTEKGQVKLMDFGLAKRGDLTMLTKTGATLGTVPYMSPEQALGEKVDHRTDIWSLGAVLYEMITGQLPFKSQYNEAIVYSILNESPEPVTGLRTGVPVELERIIDKCLEKKASDRYQHMDELTVDLRGVARSLGEGKAATGRIAPTPAWKRRVLAAGVAGLVLGLAVAGVVAWRLIGEAPPALVARFSITLPEGERLPPSFNQRVVLSPDSRNLVYLCMRPAGASLFLRPLNGLEAKLLVDVGSGGAPFYSPDGEWLAYIEEKTKTLKKLPMTGGAAVKVLEWESFGGGTWGPDGSIYYVPSVPGGIVRFPSTGGEGKEIVKPDAERGERSVRHPHILPSGRVLLYTLGTAESETFNDTKIVALSLDTGEKKTLVDGGTYARSSPTGHVLYARNGTIMAASFDEKRLALTSQPAPVVEGVLMSITTGQAYYNVSARGDLVYVPGVVEGGKRTPVWVDRQGKAEALPLPPRSYLHPRISPDGGQLAIEVEGPNHNLYVYDFGRGVMTKMTMDGSSHWPLWTPDGKHITYRAGVMGVFSIWSMLTDRSGPAAQLSKDRPPQASQSAVSWTPDGHELAYVESAPGMGGDIYVLSAAVGQKPRPVVQSKFAKGSPKFSQDGRWLAYCSSESGRPEVYVQSYPGPGPKIQVSSDGGTDPVWRQQGGELFYRSGDKMMVVPVSTQPTFMAGKPRLLWEGHYSHGMSSSCGPPGPTSSNYDVTTDGQRFFMIKDPDQDAASTQIIVVLNWAEELKRKLAPVVSQ